MTTPEDMSTERTGPTGTEDPKEALRRPVSAWTSEMVLDHMRRIRDDAYQAGLDVGRDSTTRTHLTTSPDAWTPVRLRWRYVRPGDVFVALGRLWAVVGINGWHMAIVSDGRYLTHVIDPDEEIDVLLPAAEAEALASARVELGATVVDRRV